MFSLILDRAIFFLIILNLYSFVVAGDDVKDDNIDRGSRSERGGLWFGPRLGKRSLHLSNEDNRQTFLRLLEAADALKYYYDQLPYESRADDPETKVTKKVIFTPKLGRSLNKFDDDKRYESVDFTPRLGRRLADELRVTPSDQDAYRQEPDQIDSRSKYFSPRLGRNMNLTPRLGRELAYDVFPERVRVVRSANKTAT